MMALITQITGDLFDELFNNGVFELFTLTFIISIGISIFVGIKNQLTTS